MSINSVILYFPHSNAVLPDKQVGTQECLTTKLAELLIKNKSHTVDTVMSGSNVQLVVGMTVATVYSALVLGLMSWYIWRFIPKSTNGWRDRIVAFLGQRANYYALLFHSVYPVQVLTGMYSRLAS